MTVHLRRASPEDAPALAVSEREHLRPWEPERPAAWSSEGGRRESLEREDADRSRAFVIVDEAGMILGLITLASVVRGAGQFCSIGYWVAQEATGRGVATAAVGEALDVAFGEFALHRVQAETLPHNHASHRVLERHGFQRYGLAPQYLRIAGRWQDHELWQVLAPKEEQ